MMMNYLADVMISGEWLTGIVVAIIGALGGVWVKAKSDGKKEAQMIGPQPFEVQLKAEFVTRREFEKLENTMLSNVAEMKATAAMSSLKMESLFSQAVTAMTAQTKSTNATIERRHNAVMEEINSVAEKAYAARGRIHETTREHGERLAAAEVNGNVAAAIGKLADAICPSGVKVQPTHPHA